MVVNTPPMGWNSWNTFGTNISDQLIREVADKFIELGLDEAGYKYVVIDDCWSLRDRDPETGKIVADPEKFPAGMKALSDYVHSKGLKFGMYSCAGLRTCGNYPGSFGHEFLDAQTFAEYGCDYLKYDYCYFPHDSAKTPNTYLVMGNALRACGREILYSLCNWGQQDVWTWAKAVGGNMYRSTGDIFDNAVSFSDIAKSQLDKYCYSGATCFNDMDMLTVGMCGNGNVGIGKVCTYEEYRLQFTLWALCGVPLMMGADLRSLAPEYKALMQHKDLLRINQDEECRAPYIVRRDSVCVDNPDPQPGEPHWKHIPDSAYVLLRHLTDGEFALFFTNLADQGAEVHVEFADLGLPATGGIALQMRDVFTGEVIDKVSDSFHPRIEGHDCKLYLCKLVKADA